MPEDRKWADSRCGLRRITFVICNRSEADVCKSAEFIGVQHQVEVSCFREHPRSPDLGRSSCINWLAGAISRNGRTLCIGIVYLS